MNIGNFFKISLKALANNKLRTFLTMLGIIIGVGSVITMLAIGQGSKKSIQSQISEMGSITTYEVDTYEMGRNAIYNLIRKIGGERYRQGVMILEGHMVPGDSVKKIN